MTDERVRASTHANRGDAAALFGAIGAVVFALLALFGVAPRVLVSLGAMSIGIGLIGRGALITSRLHELPAPSVATEAEATIGENAADEVIGGTAAIVCGVLALIGFAPPMLLGIAGMSAGGAALFAGPSHAMLLYRASDDGRPRAGSAPRAVPVAFAAAGLGSVILGVLAIVGLSHALTFAALAVLVLGTALLASAMFGGVRPLARARSERVVEDKTAAAT